MKELFLDLETYSSVSLKDCGVYRYAESEDAEVLLFGYSVDGFPVAVIDIAQGECIPDDILHALTDERVTKWAHNASFERVFLSCWLKRYHPDVFSGAYLAPSSWRCTMVWSAYMGLPLSLEQVGDVLKLSEKKLSEGKDLVRYFCLPCKPTKSNGGRMRNMPQDDPVKWDQFISYNKRDVEVEMSITEKLQAFPVPDRIWNEYHLSEEINDRGILIDNILVQNALDIDEQIRERLTDEMKRLTDIENPNSVMQLKAWMVKRGMDTESLDKKTVTELLKTAPPDVSEVLTLRRMLSKSSVKKYKRMMDTMCADGRARGMFQFYGAMRTGRWAGRHIQLQNLPQNHLSDLAEARALVRNGDIDTLDLLYDNIPDVLSQLVRTAFVPRGGHRFIVADFSAVEARVLSFIARESWRIKVFRDGQDIYCASASQMFRVPVEKHGQNAHLRQKGKIAELALGYGGSVGALKAMGALEMGLSEEELQPLVNAWRNANANIVQLWWDVDDAVKTTIRERIPTKTHGIGFEYRSGMLFMILPSGRRLSYVRPRIELNQYGNESVTYEGLNTAKKWSRIESYGPKFVENAIQAISRDLLAAAMKRLQGVYICGHVHDEIIIEAPGDRSVEDVCTLMGMTPDWISGLLLRADGYECEFYQKD